MFYFWTQINGSILLLILVFLSNVVYFSNALMCATGREDRFGLYGRGSTEEAKQEQEVGQEAC